MYGAHEIVKHPSALAALVMGLALGIATPKPSVAGVIFTDDFDADTLGRDLVNWAKQAKRHKGYGDIFKELKNPGPTVPEPPKSRQAPGRAADAAGQRRQRQAIVGLAREGRRLNEEILRAGPSMSAAQAQRFTARMKQLVSRMDVLGKQQKSAGPAACMKECDGAYPGWGGGKGWNRFWCKAGCVVGHIAAKAKKN